MKMLRNVVMGIAVFGVLMFLSGVSFADEGAKTAPEHHAAKVKLLQDSAAALAQSNPALSKGLTDYANAELKEKQEKKEGEGKAEEQMEATRAAHIKLLRDAAAALQATHPDLAADLTKMADKHEKKMKDEEKKDSKEAGEKKE